MPYPNGKYTDGNRNTSHNELPSLEPLDPGEGVDRYLRRRRSEVAEKTIDEYARKLDHFLEWCDEKDLENLNALSGRSIDDFRVWRREESSDEVESLGPKTMRDDMYLFKSFLAYLESIEAVRPGLSELVEIPTLDRGEGVRDIELPPERVQEILDVFRAASDPVLTTSEVAENFSISHRGVRDRLQKLEEEGVLESKKVGARGMVWWYPDYTELCG